MKCNVVGILKTTLDFIYSFKGKGASNRAVLFEAPFTL